MAEHDAFAERGRALEEEYFRKRDRELVERLRQATAASEARAAIEQKTGLSDPATLQELLDLGFTPDTVGLLPLVPLVEVAWAEGGVTDAERELIVTLARTRGITDDSPAGAQLATWLAVRPAPAVFSNAGRLIAALLASGSGEVQRGLTADDLVAYCEQIAASSGGIFGTSLRSVSAEERALLSRIAGDLTRR